MTKHSYPEYMKNSYQAIRKKDNFLKKSKGREQALHQEDIQMGNKGVQYHYSSGKYKDMRPIERQNFK